MQIYPTGRWVAEHSPHTIRSPKIIYIPDFSGPSTMQLRKVVRFDIFA